MFSSVALARLTPRELAKIALRPISSTANLQQNEQLPRPVRLERCPKVRMGFIPDSWFTAFYPKTGVTGPYVFGATLGTYLLSKEIYILEHEYYSGLSILVMLVVAIKKFGPSVGASLNKQTEAVAKELDQSRQDTLDGLANAIKAEEEALWQAEGQKLLIEAKRENVQLQLEAAYRERIMQAYNVVKKRLDYQVEKVEIERRIAQKNLVDWVVQNVLKSITPQQEKDTLSKCVADLNALATRT